MDLSFQEKTLWLMLVALVVAFAFYFASVLPSASADVLPQQVVLFVVATAVLVVVQVAGHIVIAARGGATGTDERDDLIGLKGARNAGYVLATGVFAALCVALVKPGNFAFTHVLLAFWLLAELIEIGSQLYLHRRAA